MTQEITPEQEERLEEVYTLQRAAYQHDLKDELAAAFSLKRRALALEETILGAEHPYLAVSLDLVAIDLYKKKHYEEAERLFRKALAIYVKTSGTATADVAGVYEWLAYIYDDQRQWRKALTFFHHALLIRKKCSQEKYFDLSKSLIIYADLLEVTGRTVRAKATRKRATATARQVRKRSFPS